MSAEHKKLSSTERAVKCSHTCTRTHAGQRATRNSRSASLMPSSPEHRAQAPGL